MAAAKAAQSEMYSALLVRRQTLMAEFEKKASRYKDILVKEMVSCERTMVVVSTIMIICIAIANHGYSP